MVEREELQFIIAQMSRKNMSQDLAMLFITQDNMTLNDVFQHSFFTEPEFYVDVFKSILDYSVYMIKQYRSDEVCRDILLKLVCHGYSENLVSGGQANPDTLVSELIEKILLALQEFGSQQDLSIGIGVLQENPNISSKLLKHILLTNRRLDSLDMFMNIISSGYFTYQDTIDLLVHRNTYTDYTTIDDFLYRILLDTNVVIPFLYEVMSRFCFFQNPDGSIEITHRSKDKNEIELLDHLREFMFNYIMGVAEMDLFTFANSAYTRSKNENNTALQMIFNQYQLWVTSQERFDTRISNYTEHHHEEPVDMYDVSIWERFRHNACVLGYITNLDFTDNFGIFIKVFNINRLRIFKDGNSEMAQLLMENLAKDDYTAQFVTAGLDLNVYYFLDIKGVNFNGSI